jgi:hypothetical protein
MVVHLWSSGNARMDVIDLLLVNRDEFLTEVHARLLQAQEHTRRFYDAKHRHLEFAVGD